LVVQRVCLSDTTFNEQNFFAQALLPFFIDGASPVEPCLYWKYFLVYHSQTGNLVSLFTVFEAFQTAERFRTKISQVLVLPPYQRQGIASQMYSLIFDHYRGVEKRCFQLIVEDASDDFQKVQDL